MEQTQQELDAEVLAWAAEAAAEKTQRVEDRALLDATRPYLAGLFVQVLTAGR